MIRYWILFFFPVSVALREAPVAASLRTGLRRTEFDQSWMLMTTMLIVMIGFRYDVGGDWNNYLRHYQNAQLLLLSSIWDLSDPSYRLLNYFSYVLGLGMTGVNVIGGALFSKGVVDFCRSLPRPWLALACAVPYLVIVVGMGYTRQAIALGLALLGILEFTRGNFRNLVMYVIAGATFHSTAIILLPIIGLSVAKRKVVIYPLILLTFLFGYSAFLESNIDKFVEVYQDENIASSGALIRLFMNVVPSLLYLKYAEQFDITKNERRLWKIVSWICVGMFIAFFSLGMSTALDRLALYFLPIQMFVFSHLPNVMRKTKSGRLNIVNQILFYYTLVMIVWLNFANNARYWLPYRIGLA